jgi:DNA-binding transcriptional ArsR family regulator
MDAQQTVLALGALAHEARLAVFRLLVEAGPEGLPAGTIAEQLALSPSGLSFHLKELTHAGLLTPRPDGRHIHYSANFSAMNGLIAYLTANCCAGAGCELDAGTRVCC